VCVSDYSPSHTRAQIAPRCSEVCCVLLHVLLQDEDGNVEYNYIDNDDYGYHSPY
jgi:hypothetical protein